MYHLRFGLMVNKLTQPLVLITQIQRSGGTLLSQLLDGHPQVCAHPHELHIGRPMKWDWPILDMRGSPESWFSYLYEKRLESFYHNGYVKPGSNPHAKKEVLPFNFDAELQRQVFLDLLEQSPTKLQRDVLNAFFTSFFHAWSDVTIDRERRLISAFCPRVLMADGSRGRFLADYPDGFFLSLIRDPLTWFASSRRHNPIYQDVSAAIEAWVTSTLSILETKLQFAENIFVTTYEKLVTETEFVMRDISKFVGIDFHEALLMPTYASRPILPNSSYARKDYGINVDSLNTQDSIDDQSREYIEKHAVPLYKRAQLISE